MNILSAAHFDHNDTQESITVIERPLKPVYKNGQRFGYLVHTLNRERDFANSFYVRFLLEGDVLPNVLVQSNKAGVKVRKFVPEKEFRDTPWFYLVVLVGGLVTGAMGSLFGYLLENLFKRLRKRPSTPLG